MWEYNNFLVGLDFCNDCPNDDQISAEYKRFITKSIIDVWQKYTDYDLEDLIDLNDPDACQYFGYCSEKVEGGNFVSW